MNPIAQAVEPLRQEAVARSVSAMQIHIDQLVKDYPVGTDFRAAFPYPNSGIGRINYKQMVARRDFARRVFEIKHDSMPSNPTPITGVSEIGVKNLLEETAKSASASFDAYVAKLTQKVGACNDASVSWALWSWSVLKVTKGDVIECWKTQQIVNVSVLGKLFNQWPTRLMK